MRRRALVGAMMTLGSGICGALELRLNDDDDDDDDDEDYGSMKIWR